MAGQASLVTKDGIQEAEFQSCKISHVGIDIMERHDSKLQVKRQVLPLRLVVVAGPLKDKMLELRIQKRRCRSRVLSSRGANILEATRLR